MKKRKSGFTLIELLIAIVVIAILAAIAYPSYVGYITKSRRSDGQSALLDLANRMERYFTTNNTYVGATLANVGTAASTPGGYYTLSISATGATTYSIQAAPTGSQASQDTLCGTLTLNQLGQKGDTGTGSTSDCWQ
ncbi:MAG: type IV pilin protein [Gammaproteobacteria bacterium]